MKKIKKLFTFLVVIFVLVFICSLLLIRCYSKVIGPAFVSYAEIEIKRIASLVINKSISKKIDNGMDVDSMFEIVRNNDGEIELIDFNTVNVTRLLTEITELIENNLQLVVNGRATDLGINLDGVSNLNKMYVGKGIIFEATMGSFTGSSLITNVGPSVPVKIGIVGDVISNVSTKVSEYGINNALIEVGIKVDVDTVVRTPFVSKVVNVSVVVPVSMKVISGSIPSYYLNGLNGDSNLVGIVK